MMTPEQIVNVTTNGWSELRSEEATFCSTQWPKGEVWKLGKHTDPSNTARIKSHKTIKDQVKQIWEGFPQMVVEAMVAARAVMSVCLPILASTARVGCFSLVSSHFGSAGKCRRYDKRGVRGRHPE